MTAAQAPGSGLLERLPTYPIQRLTALMVDVLPAPGLAPILFSVGEPRHAPPAAVAEAMGQCAPSSLGAYPSVVGSAALREAISAWLDRRFAPAKVDPACEVQVVNGTREGLFSLTRTVLDSSGPNAYVVYPNPGYAVYEGATVLNGVKSWVYDSTTASRHGEIFLSVPDHVWARTALLFVCSPDNPMGGVQQLQAWRTVFDLSDRHGFTVVVDECYSEIYTGEEPPIGALQAAAMLGRNFDRLVVLSSLSKRSNVPGLRSGFMAGDRAILAKAARLRAYNGGGMNQVVDTASVAAWNDEAHVDASREKYREKYQHVIPLMQRALDIPTPDAGFFLWADVTRTGLSDEEFTRQLYAQQSVLVMPGSYLSSAFAPEPIRQRIRIALVATLEECREGARRLQAFVESLEQTQPLNGTTA
ncbi:MAG: aminotransferase class I/II-fold pyridoxal phosphate-dependent enzyme [Comamonadaceae bacterium]|nr:aminotransferase class I/II-fold pyridoxal phosphate-dependent enzyme [Comamonadaceae bacterium]